ncbi:MAG TPA: sigma-54 dependent transcriptional regulator [Flavilitoribacter sp.]|nr:sigma-54 dependent transcriptional regulator [Flavilitoribacter sp.]HMQ86453.1 sigma-54 dependent transcriptional regulator [Flavilitoribacter sp.]
MDTLLVIDDEKDILNMLAHMLELEGYEVLKASTASSGKNLLEKTDVNVILTDVKLPDGNGVQLSGEFKRIRPEAEVICFTAYGNIQDGVKAIKNGAFDYLVKGDDNAKIIPLVSKAVEKSRLQYKISGLQSRVQENFGFDQVIGRSRPIMEAINLAQKVAPTVATVLLTGPTGSGKEVFAKAIHACSNRSTESFIAINCSSLGRDLLESELFGHKAGAFTGAVKSKNGLFQEAHKGTLFLDEIGEMDLSLQAKILRVLEAGTFIPVGDTKEHRVDVRVIAATNRNLEAGIATGHFREDLYYRISGFTIRLPALHERREDIPALAEHFMHYYASRINKKVTGLSPSFMKLLREHEWKGNIRELRNVMERAVILSDTPELQSDLLPFNTDAPAKTSLQAGVFKLRDLEKHHIRQVLAYTDGNKTRAAELLGIGVTTLYMKIREYKI